MVLIAVWFIVALVLVVIEYFLSTKLRSPLWGGILPLAVLAYTVYVFTAQGLETSMQNLMPYLLVNVLLFGEWSSGREAWRQLQRDRQDESRS